MKIRLLRPIFLLLWCAVVLLANKNGRASSQGKGNTGAPGDENNSNGTPRTCATCHNSGPITASVAISVLDSMGAPVTQYKPGARYTAQVKINASGANLKGYGFQMIALRDAGNTDLDGFSDVNPNNYKIANIANGRTYAEHDNVSNTDTFNVRWLAPAPGTGAITFYASGNGVNKSGNTSGDGAGVAQLKLTEAQTSATAEAEMYPAALRLLVNPAQTEIALELSLPHSGEYRLAVFDLSGRPVWYSAQSFDAGSISMQIPAANWPAGVYVACIDGNGIRASVKVLKL